MLEFGKHCSLSFYWKYCFIQQVLPELRFFFFISSFLFLGSILSQLFVRKYGIFGDNDVATGVSCVNALLDICCCQIWKEKSLFLGGIAYCGACNRHVFYPRKPGPISYFFIQKNSFFYWMSHHYLWPQFYLLIVTIPFLGAAAGSQYICIGAMQPDCCAAFMDKTALKLFFFSLACLNSLFSYQFNNLTKNKNRNEGMLYSIFLLGGKVGGGIALAISSYILGLV